MKLVDHIIRLGGSYCDATELSLSRVSTLVFNDGKILARLAAGSDITTGRYQRALQWFSDHWPEGLDWPSDVPRPSIPAEEIPRESRGRAEAAA